MYWNFFLDFGPLNLGQLFRFTVRLNQLLADHPQANILFYSNHHPAKRANAIFLICAWQVLELKRTPEQAYYGFSSALLERTAASGSASSSASISAAGGARNDGDESSSHVVMPLAPPGSSHSEPPPFPLSSIGQATVAPLPPFHDASPCACPYELNIMDCLQGLVKAREFNFFDWDDFNVEEYEHFEQVENGDLNWIVKDRILAFAGPSYKKTVSPEGYCTLAPSDYIPYFQKKNVALVVRLNKKNYEEQDFIDAGIRHLEQFYLDGSCPPMKILQRVLSTFESAKPDQAFAVHCKAGLGRTGTCIGAYIMKHYRMTASEIIAWMRICRPGMVIGPQQQFLEDLQPVMWQEGEMMRASLTNNHISTRKSESVKTKSSRRKAPPTPESPKSVTANDEDVVDGRPGQADGLLARRNRQARATSAAAPTTPSKGKNNRDDPVPITPDTAATTKASA